MAKALLICSDSHILSLYIRIFQCLEAESGSKHFASTSLQIVGISFSCYVAGT